MMMVVGLSHRLIPMMLPAAMPTGRVARAIFLLWVPGVPGLAAGLALESHPAIAASAALLLGGCGDERRLSGPHDARGREAAPP